MNYIIPIVSVVAVSAFCYFENNIFETTKIKIKCNVKNNIKIVQLSDLHSKEFGKNNIRLYNKVLDSNPDLVFTTGDLIDSTLKKKDKIIDFLVELNKKVPVVFILGNNESRSGNGSDILRSLKEKGIIALANEVTTLEIKGEKITILGLAEEKEDNYDSVLKRTNRTYGHKDTPKLFNQLDKLDGIKIVLSHFPENFELNKDKNYSKYNFDLMFAGHAHGGQFILPFIGGLFAPGQGILPKYYKGVYGKETKLIVSRGLGNSGFPLRIFNRPDIVVVELNNN